MSLIFGAVGAGQAGAFAPNYMPKPSFNYSANRIFFLLDRVPLIDGYVPLIDGYSAHAGMRMYIYTLQLIHPDYIDPCTILQLL